jgi:hypothetical protein
LIFLAHPGHQEPSRLVPRTESQIHLSIHHNGSHPPSRHPNNKTNNINYPLLKIISIDGKPDATSIFSSWHPGNSTWPTCISTSSAGLADEVMKMYNGQRILMKSRHPIKGITVSGVENISLNLAQ